MENQALMDHLLHFIFCLISDNYRADLVAQRVPEALNTIPDNRGLLAKLVIDPFKKKIYSEVLKTKDPQFKQFNEDYDKLKQTRSKIMNLYDAELKFRQTELKLQKETAEFKVVKDDLKSDFEVSELESVNTSLSLGEGNEQIQKIPIEQYTLQLEFILSNRDKIQLDDLLKVDYLINTCLKDMDIMKQRMQNENYKTDYVFSNYLGWYMRFINNIKKFGRRILVNKQRSNAVKKF